MLILLLHLKCILSRGRLIYKIITIAFWSSICFNMFVCMSLLFIYLEQSSKTTPHVGSYIKSLEKVNVPTKIHGVQRCQQLLYKTV